MRQSQLVFELGRPTGKKNVGYRPFIGHIEYGLPLRGCAAGATRQTRPHRSRYDETHVLRGVEAWAFEFLTVQSFSQGLPSEPSLGRRRMPCGDGFPYNGTPWSKHSLSVKRIRAGMASTRPDGGTKDLDAVDGAVDKARPTKIVLGVPQTVIVLFCQFPDSVVLSAVLSIAKDRRKAVAISRHAVVAGVFLNIFVGKCRL